MIYLAALLAVVLFTAAFHFLRIVPVAANVVSVSRDAMQSARSSDLNDDEKESIMQRSSLILLGGFLSISVRGAAALAISTIPLFAMQAAHLVQAADVVKLLSSWQAIVAISFAMTVVYVVASRVNR